MGKEKLNLSIQEELKKDIKHIAISEDKTVSEMIEIFIRAVKNNREIIKVLEAISKENKKKKK